MKSQKKCKGTGKAMGHGCGAMVPQERYGKPNRRYGLGLSCGCFAKWLYRTPEGLDMIEKHTLKATKPRREMRAMEAEDRRLETVSRLLADCKRIAHEIVRTRDKGKACVSCDAPWHPRFQAGHYYKAETFPTLKFNLKNIHGQCPKCNISLEGNLSMYSTRIQGRIGKPAWIELQALAKADHQTEHKWDPVVLTELREALKAELKELKLKLTKNEKL